MAAASAGWSPSGCSTVVTRSAMRSRQSAASASLPRAAITAWASSKRGVLATSVTQSWARTTSSAARACPSTNTSAASTSASAATAAGSGLLATACVEFRVDVSARYVGVGAALEEGLPGCHCVVAISCRTFAR
ncbi:hypothetical protein VNG_2041H [Halobacterium salinarum NRC-1]|uniref:Spurious ORF n=1 Tax=Halobacterium salinarum (strain ATCC 700922 / JCM 11081 / NRC-1) TaxID=64091 RepID=Q9HNM0_HALSA|nr:hypothetical protein VNG_2041H [Halobacterium salinarum NRC-1]DAC78945.1 TPA_inf: spurious ORF [Halobacterium salinarum NRC-1]